MPQINISTEIDTEFLAKLAGLENAWGATNVSESIQSFAFLAKDIDSVERALTEYDEAYLSHHKRLRIEELASKRKIQELKGPQGLVLDDKTVLRLLVKCRDLERYPNKTGVRWEVSRGNFQFLPREVVLGIADTAVNTIEACFENVFQLTEAINAVSIETTLKDAMEELYNIDIDSGWPT